MGNRDCAERKLPCTEWTWRENVKSGRWSLIEPKPAVVPARWIFSNGVWVKVKTGVEGLVVYDRTGQLVVYVICRLPTRYYWVMTQSEWMPRLIGEEI